VSASCVKSSNPHSLYSSEKGIKLGIRSWRKHVFEWARCRKAVFGLTFRKKAKSWDSTTWCPIGQFQTWA
jgi:predicted membrane protein